MLNGALTALGGPADIVGTVTLGMITARGIIRDVLLESLPATFSDWRYLVVAAGHGLIAFGVRTEVAMMVPIKAWSAHLFAGSACAIAEVSVTVPGQGGNGLLAHCANAKAYSTACCS